MKCWLPWTLLAAVVIGATALLAYMRGQQSDWLAHDKVRVAEIDLLTNKAADAKRKADAWVATANALQKQKDALQRQLDASTTKVRKRPKPVTIADCAVQLGELEAHIALLDEALVLESKTVDALSKALVGQTERADTLEQAWKLERARAEGFKKMTKRDKVKKAFIAIGALGVGGVTGWGIGRATQ